MSQLLSICTLDIQTANNDLVVRITTDGTVPLSDDFIELYEGTGWNQTEIQSVALVGGNQYDLTIHVPMDLVFTTSATCLLVNCDMNVNGSVTPVEFCVSPKYLTDGETWHLTRYIVAMVLSSAGDDGLFGNLTALTNGQDFRLVDGVTYNDLHVQDNSDFAASGFDIAYPTRSGGTGSFGMRARITFNGADKRGVVKSLSSTTNDRYCTQIKDNITGINKYRIRVQGHIVD